MMVYSKGLHSHMTFNIGMVRAEAETILKLVHGGLEEGKWGESERDIGASFVAKLAGILKQDQEN